MGGLWRRTLHTQPGGTLTTDETKTYAGARTILLPASTAELLRRRQKTASTAWIFPDPLGDGGHVRPGSASYHLKRLLNAADLPGIRFHDLRHTFAIHALASGVDAKTLSAVIGHVSAATTLDICTHVTDQMRTQAAEKIDRRMGGKPAARHRKKQSARTMTDFQARPGTRRRPGTGCVTQIDDHLWEGRYSPKWPDGKKLPRNIYAHSLAECEEKLAAMIREVQAEMAAAKVELKNEAT